MIVGGGFEKCSDLTLVALLAGHMTAPVRVLGQPVCFDCPTKSCQSILASWRLDSSDSV